MYSPSPNPVKPLSAAASHTMVPVIAGATCIGFLLSRGREGVEAFDRDELSLGLFACPIEAAAAVEKSAAPACPNGGCGQ